MIIHQVKETSFKDKTGNEVHFTKALYETENDLGVAILKGSSEKIGVIFKAEKPFECGEMCDIVRQPGKMPRLYIY